jgi:putative addiction module component (TIGR02574 family)
MSLPLERLEAEALELSVEDRARLAQRLLESLDDLPEEDLDEIERAWNEEIERRIADLEAGKAELIPAEQVFAEVRARLKG